ncbi:MAG: apolipoprotein N-acyltransferase [Burkholderiaceae bacterium]|nr:apolipoprotein N-acyltransferase [Burkholderiaceae bacterium]
MALMISTPVSWIAPAPRDARANQSTSVMRVQAHRFAWLISLAITCGAGVVLAFAHDYEWLFPLAFLAIAVFLGIASLTRRPGFGFALGLTFGISCFGAGLPWLFDLLDRLNAPLAATLLPLCLIGALSVPTAVVGACIAGARPVRAARLLLVAPALWIGFDWIRHQGEAAFPWLSVGYTQIGLSPIAGYAPVGGVLLVGFITVLTGALLAIAAVRRDLRTRAIVGACAIFALGALLREAPWTTPAAMPLRIAALQGNVGAEAKFDSAALSRTLARYESLIRSSQADVMLLPESALPLPAHAIGGYLSALSRHARQTATDVLVGAYEIEPATGRRYSSAISLGVSGTQVYRKRQLVPFGDFVPWGAALYESVQRVPFADTARGAAQQLLPVLTSGRVAIAICYEDVFGHRMRADAAASGWIANLSNDGWGGSRQVQRQHARIAQARAVEFGRPMMRAADTGQSGLIDERGHWVDSLPLNEIGALEVEVTPRTGVTPYARWGDRVALALCALALIGAVFNRVSLRDAYVTTETQA